MKYFKHEPWNLLTNDATGVLRRMRNQINHMFDHDLSLFTDNSIDIATNT